MLSDAFEIVLMFQWFLITAVVLALAGEILFLIGSKKFGWNRKNLFLYGFFFGLDNRQVLWLCSSCLWLILVVTSAVFLVEMELAHLAGLIILAGIRAAAWFSPGRLVRDLINSLLLFAALLSENLLVSYLRETKFQWQIAAVLLVLILFVISYSLYFAVKDLDSLIRERGERHEIDTAA